MFTLGSRESPKKRFVYLNTQTCIVSCLITHVLAPLHFNENVRRECQDGNQYMKATYPKYKLGDEVVREVAVPPTYGEYVKKSFS